MAMKGYSAFSLKLQHCWSLTIRLFCVIYRTLIGEVLPLCRNAVGVFYSLSRLVHCRLENTCCHLDFREKPPVKTGNINVYEIQMFRGDMYLRNVGFYHGSQCFHNMISIDQLTLVKFSEYIYMHMSNILWDSRLVGWFYGMLTLLVLFKAEVVFTSNYVFNYFLFLFKNYN